jgi:hypothetical protein
MAAILSAFEVGWPILAVFARVGLFSEPFIIAPENR